MLRADCSGAIRIFELRIAIVTRKQKYNVFRALHERHGAFVIPNPWNAGTARILTALGFEALATTSAGYAFAVGRLDSAAGLTRDAILENAKSIVEATHLPVSADLEDGFGRSPKKCASFDSRPRSGWSGDPSRMQPAIRKIPSMGSNLQWSELPQRRKWLTSVGSC